MSMVALFESLVDAVCCTVYDSFELYIPMVEWEKLRKGIELRLEGGKLTYASFPTVRAEGPRGSNWEVGGYANHAADGNWTPMLRVKRLEDDPQHEE